MDQHVDVVLSADISRFTGPIAAAGTQIKSFGADVIAMNQNQAYAWDHVGRSAGRAGATAAIGLGLSAKAAVDWQSQFAGVEKTVDASRSQLNALNDELRAMAREMPNSHEEIAAVAEAAGQLGVKTEDIADFTRTMLMMGATTNVTSEDAATSIAQFMNVMESMSGAEEQIGNTIVALGNKGASTEQQILSLTQRLAGAGALVDATEDQILGLAAAMANLGIAPELGGGAIQRVFVGIENAVASGSEKVEEYARVAGVSAEEFADAWQNRPMEAFEQIVLGLQRVQDQGGNVTGALSDMGITGTQNLQVMLRLAASGDMLSKTLDQSAEAWAENEALLEEFTKRADTDASRMVVAWNRIRDAGIEIGDVALPIIAEGAELIGSFADAVGQLPDPLQDALAGLLAIVAVVGGAAWFGAKVIGGVRNTGLALQVLRAGSDATTVSTARTRVPVRGLMADLKLLGTTAMTAGAQSQRSAAMTQAAWTRTRQRLAGAGKGVAAGAGVALLASGAADSIGMTNTASLALIGTLGGPWGAAIGGAIGLLMDMAAESKSAGQATEDLDAVMNDSTATYTDRVEAIIAAEKAAEAQHKKWVSEINDGNLAKGLLDKVVSDPLGAVNQGLSNLDGTSITEELEKRAKDAAEEMGNLDGALTQIAFTLGENLARNDEGLSIVPKVEDLGRVAERIQPALDDLGLTLDDLGKMTPEQLNAAEQQILEWMVAADSAEGRTQAVAGAFEGLNSELGTSADLAGDLKDALDQLLGTQLALSDANDAYSRGLNDLSDNLSENGRQLTGNTTAALDNRAAVREQVANLQDMLTSQAAAGVAPERIAQNLARAREEIIATGKAAGLQGPALRRYLNQLGLTPKMVRTIFETLGIDMAQAKARALARRYNAIPKQIRTKVSQIGGEVTEAKLEKIRVKGERLTKAQIKTILAAQDNASVKVDGVQAKVKKLDESKPKPTVSVNDNATPTIDRIMGGLARIDGYHATATVTVNRRQTNSGGGGGGGGDPLDLPEPTERRSPLSRIPPSAGRSRIEGSIAQRTVVQSAPLPDRLTLEVEGQKFTAFIRGHAARAASDVVDAAASSSNASGRMGWE